MSNSNAPTKDDSEKFFLYMSVVLFIVFGYILWEILQSPTIQILKSFIGGLLLIYFSWELAYFDSIAPGVMPVSPLSPSTIKKVAGHTLHLNNAIAVINGAFFALFINWYA